MAKKKLTIEDILVSKEDIPYEVPENWCWVKWGFLGDFIAGTGFKPKYQGFTNLEIPFYKVSSLKNIDSNGYIYIDDNTINEDMRIELKAKIIPKNSILFAKVGEAIKLNRRALAIKNCCIDNNTMSFQCNENINYRYIYYWSKNIELYDHSNATTVPSIRKSDLENILVPLPPLAEQERIVNRIESLFEKVDKASELVEEAREGFEKRRAAILEKAFSGELTKSWRKENGISDEWKSKIFKEIFKFIGGGTPSKSNNDYWNGDIFWASVKDIKNDYLDYTQDTITQLGVDNSSTNIAEIDDIILITRISPGKITIAKNRIAINQDLKIVKPLIEVNNKFIYYLFLTKEKEIVSLSQGTTVKGITIDKLNKIQIKLPSLDEQEEIVRILDKLINDLYKSEDLIDLNSTIELIKKSILAKAFRGELGSNNLEEESSIELLKEILK